MICVLIGYPGRLALRVPLHAPLSHLLDLPLLSADDILSELLYLRVIALFEGHLSHLYCRLMVRDHGVYERLVEGLLVRQLLRVHHHAHTPHLFRAHLHGHVRWPELFLFDGFELLYLGLLARDDVPRELDYLLVLGVFESDLGHRNSALVVGNHSIDESLVRIFAFLHDHLPGHSTRAHAHRPVAHLAVVHLAVAAPGLVTLLTTPCATAG